MFIYFSIFIGILGGLVGILFFEISYLNKYIDMLWETIDEDEELFTNLCKEVDDIEESVDNILAYLEDGGENKKK